LPPTMLEKYSDLLESKQRFNKQMNYYDKPKPLGIVDSEGHYLYAGNEGLFYFDVKDGKPTGEKVFVGEVSQYSKISVPKATTGAVITQGEITKYETAIEDLKKDSITKLIVAGELDETIDDKPTTIKNVTEGELEEIYKDLKEDFIDDDLNENELAAYETLRNWQISKKRMEEHRMGFINQDKKPIMLDADGKVIKDTTVGPTFDLNADNWVQ